MTLEHISAWAAFKNLSYIVAFTATVEWLGFAPESLGIFGILMTIDVVTGIMRSIVQNGGSSFTSRKLHDGLIRKVLLTLALLSCALAAKGVGYNFVVYAQGALNILILGELYSILGNVHSARTGNPKNEFDAVTFLLNRVEEIIKKISK